eukprot:11316312-Alexandrium_andersonii.AAC.1
MSEAPVGPSGGFLERALPSVAALTPAKVPAPRRRQATSSTGAGPWHGEHPKCRSQTQHRCLRR